LLFVHAYNYATNAFLDKALEVEAGLVLDYVDSLAEFLYLFRRGWLPTGVYQAATVKTAKWQRHVQKIGLESGMRPAAGSGHQQPVFGVKRPVFLIPAQGQGFKIQYLIVFEVAGKFELGGVIGLYDVKDSCPGGMPKPAGPGLQDVEDYEIRTVRPLG
jgi:hypothetical protein